MVVVAGMPGRMPMPTCMWTPQSPKTQSSARIQTPTLHPTTTSMQTCIHASMQVCIHAYMHTCVHAYMHTCITHTCIPGLGRNSMATCLTLCHLGNPGIVAKRGHFDVGVSQRALGCGEERTIKTRAIKTTHMTTATDSPHCPLARDAPPHRAPDSRPRPARQGKPTAPRTPRLAGPGTRTRLSTHRRIPSFHARGFQFLVQGLESTAWGLSFRG